MVVFTRSTRFIVVGWLLSASAGMVNLLNYQSATGRIGMTPDHWPAPSGLSLDQTRPTLMLFAHPKCPCTRASIDQLSTILASNHSRMSAHVVLLESRNDDEDWGKTALRTSVSALPVTIHDDKGGELAELFGAKTSGFVALYSPAGQLLFKGGITAGRGHFGDNEGADAIASLLAGQKTIVRQTPVYGCALHDEPRTCHASTTPPSQCLK